MRAVALAILLVLLSACGHTEQMRLQGTPPKFAVEQFTCLGDPGAWRADASDNEIATNRRQALAANEDCRREMKKLCLQLAANDQVVGRCEDLPA